MCGEPCPSLCRICNAGATVFSDTFTLLNVSDPEMSEYFFVLLEVCSAIIVDYIINIYIMMHLKHLLQLILCFVLIKVLNMFTQIVSDFQLRILGYETYNLKLI